MSLSNVLEQYTKNLNTLSGTVCKNMLEIRNLDSNCQKLNFEAQKKSRNLISSWRTANKDSKKKTFETIKVSYFHILWLKIKDKKKKHKNLKSS